MKYRGNIFQWQFWIRYYDPTVVYGKKLKHILGDTYTYYLLHLWRSPMVSLLTTLFYVVRIFVRPSWVLESFIFPLCFNCRAARLSLLRDLQSASLTYTGHLEINSGTSCWLTSSSLEMLFESASVEGSRAGELWVVAQEPGRWSVCCSGGGSEEFWWWLRGSPCHCQLGTGIHHQSHSLQLSFASACYVRWGFLGNIKQHTYRMLGVSI